MVGLPDNKIGYQSCNLDIFDRWVYIFRFFQFQGRLAFRLLETKFLFFGFFSQK